MIKTIIIDDNKDIRDFIENLINEHFPTLEICATADNVIDGTKIIKQYKPELVLLDIELKDGTGFDILQNLESYTFKLIFITAFNNFAIKAIKFSALDYILKPINELEFITGIKNALQEIENSQLETQITNLFEHYEKKTISKKIILRNSDNLHIINVNDIIYCQSDNSYTTFYINNADKILMSKSIKEYSDMLAEYGFFRSHQSFLVNLQHITRLCKHDGSYLILSNNKQVPVSTRQKAKLISILERLAI